MRSLIVLFTIVVATCGCQDSKPSSSTAPAPTISVTAPSSVELASQRQNDWGQFLAGCQFVVDRTHDQEASNLLAFLKMSGRYCSDIPVQMPTFDAKTIPTFSVFVLEAEDQPEWAQSYFNDPLAVANFHPAKQSMILRHVDDYSPLWLGITVLHETRHAHSYLVTHTEWAKNWAASGNPDTKIFCYDEAQTHMFHGRLFRKIGGEAYEQLVAEVLTKLEATAPAPLKEVFNQNGTVAMLPQEYPSIIAAYPSREAAMELESKLDAIFGTAQSDKERFSRISLFNIDLNFVLADKYAKDPLDSKAFYLACQYQKNQAAMSK